MFGQLGAADVIFKGRRVGVVGVVHPEVLQNYDLKKPVGTSTSSVGHEKTCCVSPAPTHKPPLPHFPPRCP